MSMTFFTTNAEGKEVAGDFVVQMANSNAWQMQILLFPTTQPDHAGTCKLETAMAELLRLSALMLAGCIPQIEGQDVDYVQAKVGYLIRLVLKGRLAGATDLRWG